DLRHVREREHASWRRAPRRMDLRDARRAGLRAARSPGPVFLAALCRARRLDRRMARSEAAVEGDRRAPARRLSTSRAQDARRADPGLMAMPGAKTNDAVRVRLMSLACRHAATVEHVALPLTSTAEQIMAMPVQRVSQRKWTVEEFYAARDAAPPGERWELVDGEVLVTPSPHWTHQRIVMELTLLLGPYVKRHALGELFASPLDVNLEPGLILQPDILVVPPGELRVRSDTVRRLVPAIG